LDVGSDRYKYPVIAEFDIRHITDIFCTDVDSVTWQKLSSVAHAAEYIGMLWEEVVGAAVFDEIPNDPARVAQFVPSPPSALLKSSVK
jgi:hypothetical protein